MHKYKFQQWFKSLFDFESLSKSKHPKSGRLSVEALEIRLTPDAKALPAFHDLGIGLSGNNCTANSVTLVDDISVLQNLTDCRSSHVYFCPNGSPDNGDSTFLSVNKLDALALQAAATKGVVLIDSSLVASIPVEELKGSLVVSIDGNRDVVSQITTALEGLANVPVLKIISHGTDGVLWFGDQAFDASDLSSSALQIASWGKSLTADADILLYGCSVASTDAGKAFVQQLATLTEADVAASSNLTGKGGDEVLEFQVGQVSNSLIASAIDYYSANLTLAQITVTTTADTGAGSLRQAITDANSTSANDEIIFASSLFTNGASTITLGSAALPTIAATTSAGSLAITGPGASSLIISGDNGNTSRNFSIFNIASGGNLAISGVTVSGAKTTGNGAGFSNLGTLMVANSLITGNTAAGGGGIYSRGLLTINSSTFSGNSTTSQNGGAVWNYGGSANLSILNSTISSNTATTSSGGGIGNTGGTVILSDSTLFANQASGGGGIFNNANGTFTIFNSTISNNSATINGGGIHIGSGTLNISNTIIANSTSGGDVYSAGSIGANTSNLVTQVGLAWATTVTSAQLNLGPLQNNGGTTATMALGAGSVAIGAGSATISNASPINGLDQRGVTRSTTAPSIGAFEYLQLITFSPQTTIPTWNRAGKVITADVNNDGKQDIVVQNIGYGEPNAGPRHDYVSVFLGKGDGTFETRRDTATGSYSNWLASGDFNGDGKVDFVTPNYCGESISILLGKGDGTFNRQDMSNAGGTTSPSFVITGDVNGDGKIDILTTNQNSSNVTIFLGNGNGTFQVPTLLSTSAIPSRIVAGDFNSDGKLDIVVHTAPGNVPANTLFLGTGTGGFTTPSTIAVTGELTVADFNRDGFADIAGTESDVIKVLLGNGNATFKAAQVFSASGVGASIIATDLNGDANVDLQIPLFNSNAIAAMVGNGDGSFKSPLTFNVGAGPFTLASADFNSDGKRDLVVSNLNSNNVSVLLNTSNFAPTLSPSRTVVAPASVVSINANSEAPLVETQSIPVGANVYGVKITGDYSTYWNGSGAIAGIYFKLNGVRVGPLDFHVPGTSNVYTPFSREFFGSLPTYVPGGVNTWNIVSDWNPVNLANVKIQVFFPDASSPAIALAGIEDTPLNFTAANFTNAYGDIENNPLVSITIASLPATGSLKLAGANVSAGQIIALANLGNLTYVPAPNENGTKTFTVTASDGSVSSAVATVSMNIAAVNDAPTANVQTITPTEDTTYSGTLAGTDTEGSAFTYSVVSQGAKGFVTITNTVTGAFTYVPNANANGFDSFTFKVNDGSLNSAAATVTVNITATNDAPVIGGISTSINYISTDFTTAPTNASITGSAVVSNGECVLTPAASNQYGYLLFNTLASNPTTFSAQFDYRVADGSGADGTSFNYGVIGSPAGDESGMTNTGLVVSFIEFGTQRVQIKLNGTVLQTANVTLIGSNYQRIVVNIDGSNKLSVSVGGVTVVSNLDLGATYGNADKSTWKFGFASRCGGANNKHSIDNLVISNNVAPLIALEQTPTVLAGSLTLSDVDNSTLASAIVTIATGLKTSEDVLGFVANPATYGNITGTYNSSTGALSLISAGATATLAQWQAALRSVTYTNTSDAPDTTNRNFSFVVNDGTVNSAAATVTVNVTAVNDAPVANADVYTTTEDTPLVVSLGSPVVDQQQTAWNAGLPNDGYQTFTAGQTGFLTSIDLMQNGGASNPQQVTLTVYAGDGIGGVTLGAVTISETNTYNSTLGGFVQTYTFSQPVAIVSGGLYTFKITTSSNRGLVGSSDTNSYTNGRFYHSGGHTGDLWFRTSVATSQGLLVNDSDADGNSLTAVIVTNPSNGTVVLNSDGRFTYTPNANFNGTDTFTYKASDGLSFSNFATVTVNVTPANDAPTATIQAITLTEDTTYIGTLTASDVDNITLTYSVVSQGSKGVVTITNTATGAFTYVPNANANGPDSFTFKVNDGSLYSAAATVTVIITAANDAPVANGSATLAAVNEDIGFDALGATVASLFSANFSDSQDNPANTFAGVAVSSYTVDSPKGNWQYSSNGSTWLNLASATTTAAITLKATDYLRFVPAANYNGPAIAISANLIETGGVLITSGATVNLSGGNVQINLSPANVIGGSATYGGTFNTGGFNATLVLDKQTGTIGNESSQTGYWLGPDATGSNYFVIDLGASVVIKKLEFFNTHNSFYNDRGTLTFHIDASNAIVNSGGFNLSGETTILTGTLAAASDPIIGEVFSLSSNSQAYRYLRFTADAVRNNGLNEIRIFGPAEAVVGGSTVYSQNTVSLNHTITAVNDAPNVSASQPSFVLLDYQFTLNWGVSESKIAITTTDVDSSPVFDNAFLTSNGWASADNGITFTKNETYGYVRLNTTASTLTYYLDQQSNLTGRLRQGQTVTETIPVQVTDGQLTALTNAVFTIDGQNDEPELYLVNNLVGAFEDIEYEITYANLTNKSQRADIDGSVTAFVVKNVTSGVLKIGANSQSATPWNATNNATISSGLNGYWNPALNANGTLGAFTVVVKDDGGLNSLNPLQVNVQVASVNDTPIVVNIAAVVYTNTNAVDVFANATGTISASDADANDVLTYGISGQGVVISNGSATLAGQYGTLRIVTATGEYSYAPNQSQLDRLSGDAVDNFTFTISDGTAIVNKSFVVNINDRETPSVAISSNVVRLKAGEVASVSFNFTEVPIGFTLNSLNVTGGVLSGLKGSGTSYSATFTPTVNSNTAGSVSFKADSYKDSANNFGSVATLAPVISVDTLPPLVPVVVLASDTGISATDKVTYAGIVTVSGIEANATWEFSNDNGVNWAPGPNDFTFAFKNDGAKSLFIRQTDAAGNLGPVNEFLFTLDTVAPAVPAIALNTDTGISALDKITNDGKINVAGLESTAGFEYSLNSGTTWVLGSGNSFTLTGDGAKLVRVRQIDLAGNIGAATADLQFTLDTTSTTLAVSSSSNKLKAGETATITFTFSETAYNFDYSDITVVGGVLSNLTQNLSNKKLVTATFTPLVNSITTGQISVVANYNDAAENSGTSAVLVPVIAIDTAVPTVGISSNASALKIGETTVITFSLSEPTSDFTLTDVTVTGGTLSNFAGSNNSYTATFTPAIGSTTTASIHVVAGKFADAFGNQNLASNALKIAVDTSAPVATFAQVATPRNTGVSSLDVTFAESVSGFDVSDLSLTFNGNAVSLSNVSISGSGANYTISGLNTTAQGAYVLTLNFNASGISDAAGNTLGANASVSWSVDTSSPSVVITSSTSRLNPGQTATISFTFSTAPVGFDSSDITAVGGTISGFTRSSNTVYTATLTPAANFSGKGSVAVSNGYTNAAGTAGLPGLSETIAIDTVAPSAVLSSSVDRLGVGQVSTITFTFSEAVAGFDSADILAEGGTLGTLTQSGSNPLEYTTIFTPTASFTGKGKVTLSNNYADVSGNIGLGANLAPGLFVDTAPATVDIIGRGKPLTPDTNSSAVSFNVRFNETVAGVDANDFELVLSNGVTVTNPLFVSGSGNSYTVDVSGISKAEGTLGIRLKSNAAIFDTFNNPLVNTTPGENQSYTIDNTVPNVVSIISDKPRLGTTNTATITITFSEVPKGFDAFDVGATYGTISNLAVTSDPKIYTATFTPSGVITSDARVTVYQGYSDAAGNAGTALTMVSPIAIVAAPVGSISIVPQNSKAEVVPSESITLLISFTEDVNVIADDDFTTTGTVTLSGLQRISNRAFTVVATAGVLEGDFSVGLKANATEDSGLSDNKTAAIAPIAIRVDASSSFANAKLVTVAQGSKTSTSGIADNINDADFFTFTAGFTGSVSTLVKADGSKFDPFATAYVQDTSNYKLLISDDNSGGGTISKMDFNVTEGKTYFIKVQSLTKTTGKYIVEITGGEKLADDYGDAQADAASLVVNSGARTTNGTLENNQDKDSFKFTASQTGKASLSFAASATLTGLATGKLEVYSNATTVLKTVAFNGSTEFDVVAGTTYYLIVSSDAGDTGDYSFTISAKASLLFTTTAGVAIAKATSFLPVAGNVDVYTVVAPAQGLLSILVENKDRGIPTQPEFSVYNAAGTKVAPNVGALFGPAGSSKQIINFNANAGETYLLKIGETGTFTGSYNITAQADDFGTASTAPTNLTTGSTAGRIELPGDADLFSYNYTNTSGNTAKLQIMQTAASGSALLSGLFVSTNNGSSWIAATQKGTLVELEVGNNVAATLLIWASGASGSTGAYNITTKIVTDDFGNNLATATTVLLDQSNTSTTNAIFNYSGDQDVFKVTLNNSGTTLFSVESNDDSLFDPKLTITSLSGQVIASDDDNGKGLGSLIVLEGTVGDTFYLTVSGTLKSANGVAYILKTADLPVDDAGNKPDASAAPLPFNAPVVVNGKSTQVAIENKTIRPAMPGIADFDVFQFTANDTGRFEISVSPAAGSTLAPNLTILASDGKTVLASTSASAGKAAFALPYLNKGDKVFVSVSGSNSSEGDYTLKVETPVLVVDFFANSYNGATISLPIGQISLDGSTNSGALATSNMNIEAARDVDVFSFTAKTTGPVKVLVSKTTSSTIDTSISIMDASGKVLVSNNDADRVTTNSAAVFEVAANAVYYISVTGDLGTTGQYGIVLQDLTPNDSDGFGSDFTNATELILNANLEASVESSLSTAGDRDLFMLAVDSDGVLGIGLNARDSNLDGYLRIYNSDKVLVAEDNDSGIGLNSFVSISASAGDVFYIQTGAVGSSIGDYKVWTKLEIDDHANLIGSSATALDVEENFAYDFGSINSNSDVDVFSFTATSTGTIDIYLGADEGSALDTYLFAYDSTGQILINYNNDISSTDKDSTLSIQVVEGEAYYFKVSGARSTTGDYILYISPVADDVGSSIDDATNLPLTVSNTTAANTSVGTTTGSIETTGDADYYKVSVSVAGRYQFKVSNDTTSSSGLEDSNLEIYSADGQLLGKNDDATSTSSDSALELNLAADDIVYVKAAGYGDKIGDYVVKVVYVGAVVADDYGNSTDNASSFVFDDSSSYSLTGAAIEVAGDFDYFTGVADINGDINITLTSASTLNGTVKAFISRDGIIVQVASEKATAAGAAISLTFAIAASDEFFIQVAGADSTIGSYDLTVTNTVSTSTTNVPKAVDSSIINSTADELSGQFTKAIADAAVGADINEISKNITQKLVDAFIASMGGTLDQSYIILWLDPADFNFSGAGTNVGNQAGGTTNQGSSTSLSTNGALNTVIVSGAQASQYSLNMTGVGSGQVLAGATMVTASGQIVNPVVTIGGSSSSGIASSEGVPKSGLNMVLDFGTNTGGGNGGGGSNGGGSNGGGSNGGGGTQVGVLPGNGGSADSSSSSSSSSSSTASASGKVGSFASLVNAIVQTSTAVTGTGSGSLLANLAAIAFGGGGTATTVNEKQLEKDLGGDAAGDGLELNEKDNKEAKILSSSDVVKATASFVSVSFAEAYKCTNLAVLSTIDVEKQVVSEIANILDKVLPILVPTEFENSVENILVQIEKTLLQEGKETLTKVANTLTDLVQARLSKNIPAAQPAKNKVEAIINTFELVATNLVPENKDGKAAEGIDFLGENLFAQELPEGFEEMLNFTSVNRNTLVEPLSNSPIVVDEQTNKFAEVAGLVAGALLAPGFLNGTTGKSTPVIGKPRKRKK